MFDIKNFICSFSALEFVIILVFYLSIFSLLNYSIYKNNLVWIMIASLNPILNLGTDRCDILNIHHLRMVNLLATICVGGTMFFSTLFWFAFNNETVSLINFLFALLFLVSFILTKEGLLSVAKYWLFIIFFTQQFFLNQFILSENFETELLLLVVPTTLVLVFKPSDRIPRYGLSLIAIFLLFLAKTFPATDPILILTETNARAAYLCVILILVLATVALMDFYLVDLHLIDKSSRKRVNEDLLTHTANSYSLFKKMEDLFYCAKKKKHSLSVIAINIDNFKHVNQMHGWQTGDKLLKHIANIIQNKLTISGFLGRLYADSFIILLDNKNSQDAIIIARKLNILINRSILLSEQTAIKSTTSIGISTLSKQDVAGFQLIDKAICAMKQAKSQGKNIISVSPYIDANKQSKNKLSKHR